MNTHPFRVIDQQIDPDDLPKLPTGVYRCTECGCIFAAPESRVCACPLCHSFDETPEEIGRVTVIDWRDLRDEEAAS